MNVKQLRALLFEIDDTLPVFFACVPPTVGTVREVDSVQASTYSTFGKSDPCVLLGPAPPDTECTGLAAQWCPRCGTCACPRDDEGEPWNEHDEFALNDPACPLHAPNSPHGEA